MTTICGHTFDETRIPQLPRILDVGARNFEFARQILKMFPLAYVRCLEPDESVRIPEELATFNVDWWRVALVGDHRETADYISFSTGEGNYIAEPWDRYRPEASWARPVKCVDIRHVTNAAYLEHWDLVKLDCEGSEFSILENWPGGGIAGQITVEFHDYKNPERWNDKYFEWLWTQLPDYRVEQSERFAVGGAVARWDTLLRCSL